jgi:hypothetical protein
LAAISAEARLLEEEMLADMMPAERRAMHAFLIRSIETAEQKGKAADGQ